MKWSMVPLLAVAGGFAVLAVGEAFTWRMGLVWLDLPLTHWAMVLWGGRTVAYAVAAEGLARRRLWRGFVLAELLAFGILWLQAHWQQQIGAQFHRSTFAKAALAVVFAYHLLSLWTDKTDQRATEGTPSS
jgi:hypothetical protein